MKVIPETRLDLYVFISSRKLSTLHRTYSITITCSAGHVYFRR